MKALNKVMIGAAALFLLTGCGPQKVTYEKFHEKAVAAHDKGHSYTKAVVNGTSESSGTTTKYSKVEFVLASGTWQPKEASLTNVVLSVFVGMEAQSVTEEEESTYYAGNGFKVTSKSDDGNGSASFNAAGLLTSIKSTSGDSKFNLTVKYSK